MQASTSTEAAYLAIWQVASQAAITRLQHPADSRGVYAAAFSHGTGTLVATVAGDDRHTVRVWDWRVGAIVAEGPGCPGVPPQVFGISWDPHCAHGSGRCALLQLGPTQCVLCGLGASHCSV